MSKKNKQVARSTFLVYVPFTGLGLYGGFRGNGWLRDRIKVFKEFVVPSLLNQTDQKFVLWVQWRPEERTNKYVAELYEWLRPQFNVVFTYGGLCFWDDKFDDNGAREKLTDNMIRTLPSLFDYTPDCEEIHVLLQPSDDLYEQNTIASMKKVFAENPSCEAVGFKKGWICDYRTKKIAEYNCTTNPPFFAYRIPREVFFDAGKHLRYISMKHDVGKYKAGTPYPSHEYIPDSFNNMMFFDQRGFIVGTHTRNISTHIDNPFAGEYITDPEQLAIKLVEFGIGQSKPLKLPISLKRVLLKRLNHETRRKLRYWVGERFVNKLYNVLLS